jgi:hypothetical protein
MPELNKILLGREWVPPTKAGSNLGDTEGMHGGGGGVTAGYWKDTGGGLAGMLEGRDASGRLPQDAANLAQAKGQLNQGYDQALSGNREAINYGAMRSGEGRLSPGAVTGAIGMAATGLERDRQSALRNLEFMSAQSSLADYNQVLSLLGQGANASLGLAQGFSGASGAAIGGLSDQTQAGSIIGGAATGAGIGTTIYPGWGTVVGGLVGAGVGAFTSP